MTFDERKRLEAMIVQKNWRLYEKDVVAIAAALVEVDRLTAKLATFTKISEHVDYFKHMKCGACGVDWSCHDPATCPVTSRAMARETEVKP